MSAAVHTIVAPADLGQPWSPSARGEAHVSGVSGAQHTWPRQAWVPSRSARAMMIRGCDGDEAPAHCGVGEQPEQ